MMDRSLNSNGLAMPDRHGAGTRGVRAKRIKTGLCILTVMVLLVFWANSGEGQQVTTATSIASLGFAASHANPEETCSLHGTVRNDGGTAISGSHIRLTASGGDVAFETVTGDNGKFDGNALAAGQYILLVTMEGFLPGTYPIRLCEQGATDVVLKMAVVIDAVTVTASRKEIAQAELHMQEQQRLVGVLPNFYISYQWNAAPLSSRQKFSLAFRNASDPANLMVAGITAGIQQANNAFPGFGQGAAGYGRRYGANVGNLVAGTFMGGAVLPSIFHQDPRYFYRGTGSVQSRVWYAATRAVVTRGDNGHSQPNWSGMLGDMSTGAISNLYYAPEDSDGARLTLINGLVGIGGDAVNGILQEFLLRHFTTHTKGRNGKAIPGPPD